MGLASRELFEGLLIPQSRPSDIGRPTDACFTNLSLVDCGRVRVYSRGSVEKSICGFWSAVDVRVNISPALAILEKKPQFFMKK
jgi:hypothetical protein